MCCHRWNGFHMRYFVLHRSQNAKWKIVFYFILFSFSFEISKWTPDSGGCRIFVRYHRNGMHLALLAPNFAVAFFAHGISNTHTGYTVERNCMRWFPFFWFSFCRRLFCKQLTQTDSIETLAKITVIARALALCLRFSFQNALNRNLCASMYRERGKKREITVPYAERAQISLDETWFFVGVYR